jgi:LytS/YehU family sensor histidine kinase
MWDYPGVNDGAAIIVNWTLLGLLAAGLGLSFTVARRTRLGWRSVRWALVVCVVLEIVQMINLYVQQQWAAGLFFLVAPVALGAIAAEVRFRAGRRRDGAQPAERTAKL